MMNTIFLSDSVGHAETVEVDHYSVKLMRVEVEINLVKKDIQRLYCYLLELLTHRGKGKNWRSTGKRGYPYCVDLAIEDYGTFICFAMQEIKYKDNKLTLYGYYKEYKRWGS